MSELGDALRQIQKAIRDNVSGIHSAPNLPPESPGDFPFLVSYPATVNNSWRAAGHRIDKYTIAIELHVGRNVLSSNIEEAVSFSEDIPGALKTAEIAGELSSIDHFGDMNGIFGAMAWGGIDTIGWRWVLNDVTIHITG